MDEAVLVNMLSTHTDGHRFQEGKHVAMETHRNTRNTECFLDINNCRGVNTLKTAQAELASLAAVCLSAKSANT